MSRGVVQCLIEGEVINVDANGIMQAISTLGFPIVMCGVMAWYVKYTTDKHRAEVAELNSSHNEEMTKVTEALNNNTLAIQKLCDKLDK